MATVVPTWATFRTEILDEAEVTTGDTTYDALCLAAANEALYIACAQTQNHRDLRQQIDVAYNGAGFVNLGDYYIHQVEQVTYTKMVTSQYEWELTEADKVVCPSPFVGYPAAYRIFSVNVGAIMSNTIRFYNDPGVNGDSIRVIFTGFKQIVNDASFLPYLTFNAFIKLFVLQRLQIRRNLPKEKLDNLTGLMVQAAKAAGIGAVDTEPK